ncbi:MAG: exosortase-associated EpsI family protein [Verrucomicrobia bacterium]|nr:exosortase-associated EpsI family protein [Verrucomicrobiota bacterium]
MNSALPFSRAFAGLPWLGKFNLLLLAAGAVALSARLWPEWRRNPDLSHGFFMPIVFLLLLHESRSHGSPRYLRPHAATNACFGALLAGGILALVAAGLYAAAVDWSHALVSLTLALALALFLGGALVAFAGDSIRLIGFNWSAVVAIGLWLLSAPIPPGTYMRLTLGLQLWVSENVLRMLHLFGIPAIRHGNIIELANTAVGVEEACSGVRSLISCVFAGLFFSATLVRRPWARAVIIALAAPLALSMNFLRSLALTLLANSGVDISGAWHDVTGFAVLGVTAAILGGLAVALEHGRKAESAAPEPTAAAGRGTGMFRALTASSALAGALIIVFVLNTRPSIRRDLPVPDVLALLPAAAGGWQVKTTDLYEFAGTLQTDHLAQRSYAKGSGSRLAEITIYVAYWRAGQAPVSLVASHTPDACWPGAGWTMLPIAQPRAQLVADGRPLPDAEYRLFQTGDYPQYVWFWHLYDGRPISYRDPYSPTELLRIAWRYGFRHSGDQLFVRLSSNRPWAEIAGEQVLADFFARIRPLGL